jgi:hypothetical protein
MTTRVIGANRYLLEFPSDRALSFVLNRGSWTFKGDALIVVWYDGLARMSEIAISSIPLRIHIFDIPVVMLTQGFVNALGSKVGRVLEVGEAVKDFQRVQVDFDLASPLRASVGIRVRGRSWMEFMVTYESVPFFVSVVAVSGTKIESVPMKRYMEGRHDTALHSVRHRSKSKRGED